MRVLRIAVFAIGLIFTGSAFLRAEPQVTCGAGTSLATCAASVTAGRWQLWTGHTGLTADMIYPGGAGGGLTFDQSGQWDSTRHKAYLWSGEHSSNAVCDSGPSFDEILCAQNTQRFFIFNDSASAFQQITDANGKKSDERGGSPGHHPVEDFVEDPATGDVYKLRSDYGGTFMKWTAATNLWSALPSAGSSIGVSGAIQGMAWYPEAGGFVLVGSNGSSPELRLYKPSTGWSNIGTGLTLAYGLGSTIGIYNSFYHNMLIGGGQGGADYRKLYVLTFNAGTSAWSVSPAYTPPTGYGGAIPCSSTDVQPNSTLFFTDQGANGHIMADPVTGHYIALTKNANCVTQAIEFDSVANTWTDLSGARTPPPEIVVGHADQSNGNYFQAVTIPDYGVIMYIQETSAGADIAHVWLYKNATGTPPTAPTACAATAQSAITAELKCTAATAGGNAIAGYHIFAGSTECGSIVGNYPILNCTGLTANTTYTIKVAAYDTIGLQGVLSSGVNVTTDAALRTFSEKCNTAFYPGVVHCDGFDAQSAIHYAFRSAVHNPTAYPWEHECDNELPYPWEGDLGTPINSPNSGVNAEAYAVNGHCNYPKVDTAIKATGAGSLQIKTPAHSGASVSEYYIQFKNYGDDHYGYIGPLMNVPSTTAVHLGNDLWIQMKIRFNTAQATIIPPEALGTDYWIFDGFTLGAGQNQIIRYGCHNDAGAGVPSDATGKKIWFFHGGLHDRVLVRQSFTITGRADHFTTGAFGDRYCAYTLDSDPTPSGAEDVFPGTGTGVEKGAVGIVGPSNGLRSVYKTVGIFGQPQSSGFPASGTNAGTSAQIIDGGTLYSGMPGTYSYGATGQSNYDAAGEWQAIRFCPQDYANHLLHPNPTYPEPPCINWHANTFQEFTIHIDMNGIAGAAGWNSGTFSCSHAPADIFIDAQIAYHYSNFIFCAGSDGAGNGASNGWGQMNLSPYNTWSDPNFDHSDLIMNFDDLVISTAPIPMLSGDVPTTTLNITTTSPLPNGTQSSAYSQTISAVNGTTPYTFAVTTGTLPAGLSLASGGVLSGTPTSSGDFSFTVTVTDNVAATFPKAFTLHVNPVSGGTPTVAITSPANGAVIEGFLTPSATASDSVSIVGVRFKLDGVNIGAEDTTAPYSIRFDLAKTKPGNHTLSAVARNPSGNTGTASITITVKARKNTPEEEE